MKDNCIYFDITKKQRDSAIRFLLSAIIKYRQEEYPSNTTVFDEDVNVYLAHLLFAVSLPDYHDMAEPYLSQDSSEVMRWVNEAEDQTIRYFIFKVNADHLLVYNSVFDNVTGRKKGRKSMFNRSHRYFRELAKLYYEQAAAYHKRIYRRKTGIGEVLDKVAYDFEGYETVLKGVRREYFKFLDKFKDRAFRGFMHEMDVYERETTLKEKMDEFLDLYGRWLETKDVTLEPGIRSVVKRIQQVDPAFKFDYLDRFSSEGGSNHEKKCA